MALEFLRHYIANQYSEGKVKVQILKFEENGDFKTIKKMGSCIGWRYTIMQQYSGKISH